MPVVPVLSIEGQRFGRDLAPGSRESGAPPIALRRRASLTGRRLVALVSGEKSWIISTKLAEYGSVVRFSAAGHNRHHAEGPKSADIVAKVENRTTLKISRKSIFGLLCYCVAFQRHYGGPWSILDEAIWSLASPRVKRISGSKNFRSPPRKDFCNNICQQKTSPLGNIGDEDPSSVSGCLLDPLYAGRLPSPFARWQD